MHDIAITVRQVEKSYHLYRKPWHRVVDAFSPYAKGLRQEFTALRDINFQVPRGESVGIIGRNGCGKSTLLQIICGILQPSRGTVHVQGRISALLELGAGFNPEFTGRENVMLNTAIQGFSAGESQRKFQEIVDFSEIGEFVDRPVKTYSSGMYVRLAFAAAISIDPEVLVIDEALAVGDIFFQQKCMEHMQKMMQGCTIVLVSHDMHAVTNLCRRVLVLDHGRMLYDGTPMEAVSLYTRLVHTQIYGTGEQPVPPLHIPAAIVEQTRDLAPWLEIDDAQRGGAGEVVIMRAAVTREDGTSLLTIQQGQLVRIHLLVWCDTAKEELIFGYTVKDRIGNAVFGENSLCLGKGPQPLPAGYSVVRYDFFWPEVYPFEYTITLGVGEGRLPNVHRVQCWVHNIIAFSALAPGRCVHGMFNTPLNHLDLIPLREDIDAEIP
ncbi:MAG: hypothetical protein BWK76_12730 [Desulfobulbaceae bacterium A2]|nr:MAG: hypothetical protein BWK76_12730 [Desulfobulbaceae bacterium A2]